jgi:DNA polymerase/3'-5' exonuclease PolX
MSVESAIEEKIKEAMARGEFDNLAGAGKPLDLDAYFNTPEDLRMAFAMLKSNEFVPREVELFKEIAEIEEEIKACSGGDSERARLTARRDELRLKLMLLLDARRRRK